jgi:hypothetical protein
MPTFYALAIIGIAVIAGIWWFQVHLRQKRIANLVQVAQDLGFEFAVHDPHGTIGMPFALFRRGDGRGLENVMWGRRQDVPTRVFDYWYYDETSDTQGNRSRNYHRYTCVAMTIAADCPTLRIGQEGLITRFGSALGFRDVELEYEDFNRRYRVKCDDQQFAFSLLDGRMMEWLLHVDGIEALELVGPFVLIATSKLASEEWAALVTVAEQFHAQIPRVVWATWPHTMS